MQMLHSRQFLLGRLIGQPNNDEALKQVFAHEIVDSSAGTLSFLPDVPTPSSPASYQFLGGTEW
jgi:hypothetical protein